MKILVLGHEGMLGGAVARQFRDSGFDVLTTPQRYSLKSEKEYMDSLTSLGPDCCVNCIGATPRNGVSEERLTEVNGALPAALSFGLPNNCSLIHASTDGVFRPDKPVRVFDEQPDATDAYGRSKPQAESALTRPNDHIIRCSVVGPESRAPARNLLSWFLSSTESIGGYTNHAWNGITTLQWARFAVDIARDGSLVPGRILQPATEPISKHEVVRMFNDIWEHRREVNAVEAPDTIVRTLQPNAHTPSLRDQLIELKSWSV